MKLTFEDRMVHSHNKWWAFLLCFLPILDPYVLFGNTMIVEFMLIAIVFFAFVCNRLILDKNLCILLLVFVLLSIISSIASVNYNFDYLLQIKVIIYQIISIIAFGFLWDKSGKDAFLKMAVLVGIISSSLAIMQFIAVTLGFTGFYDGRLPFAVGDNNHFGGLFDRNTGDLRVHSFFEEPSYLALYELPVLAYCAKTKKLKSAIIIGLSCLLTGSLLGVFGVMVVITYFLFIDSSLSASKKAVIVFLIFVIVLFGIYFYNYSATFSELFDYLFNRVTTMENELERSDSSASLRLFGNIDYFEQYPFVNKLFGTGFNQYAIYFNLGKNYSNDFVTTLLDFGVVGIVALFIVLLSLWKKIPKDSKIFFILFVIALCVDHIWFNIYFFYLLTWCVMYMQKNDPVILKMK